MHPVALDGRAHGGLLQLHRPGPVDQPRPEGPNACSTGCWTYSSPFKVGTVSVAPEYIFVWDPDKAGRNQKKHRIGFEPAATVFKDPRAISIYDIEHSRQEDRWITLGLSADHGLLVVCHTFEWVDPSVAAHSYFLLPQSHTI